MNHIAPTIPDYLRPPCDQLWRWEDNGDAATWCDDHGTIAFRSQLEQVLRQVVSALDGLPSLTSVMLVVDACNGHVDEAIVHRLWNLSDARSESLSVVVGDSNEISESLDSITEIRNWLEAIARLPGDLRSGVSAQASLITFSLQNAPRSTFEVEQQAAVSMIDRLAVQGELRDSNWADDAEGFRNGHRCRHAIANLRLMAQHRVDADALRLWKSAGTDQVPEGLDPLSNHDDEPTTLRQTLEELAGDDLWGSVAQTALDVASWLSLPRRPSDPDVLPVGGVSDVTNRGDPERLLMTELAQEPLAMLARIASGQALYLRRETPPGPSPDFRPVFLESGIRTWGSPRLEIASVGLGIAALEESRTGMEIKILSVAGDKATVEDFSGRDGIIEHLERLNTAPHPGEAMIQWMDKACQLDQPIADPIMVITAATDRDAEFRRVTSELPSGFLVVRIESDHSATLLRRTPLGDESLQSLSLQRQQPKPQPKLAGPSPNLRITDSSLALFLNMNPCPLRFADSLEGKWAGASASLVTPGLFSITSDKRLLWFHDSNLGARQLVDRVPSDVVRAQELNGDEASLVVGATGAPQHVLNVCATTGEITCLQLPSASGPATYVFDQGSLFRIGNQIELIDRHTGEVIDKSNNRLTHIGGPVLGSSQLHVIANGGNQIVTHRMTDPFKPSSCAYLAVRNSDGVLVVIDRNMQRCVLDAQASTETGVDQTHHPLLGPLKLAYQSSNKQTVVIEGSRSPNPYTPDHQRDNRRVLNLTTGQVKVPIVRSSNLLHLVSEFDPVLSGLQQTRNLLIRLSGVSFEGEDFFVVMKRGRRRQLVAKPERNRMVIEPTVGLAYRYHAFSRATRIETRAGATQWKLRTTTVGANRITADSRGLLHLRRGDDRSEITLMLYESWLSGWTSWGAKFGDPYFTGEPQSDLDADVVLWLKEFARQCSQLS